MKYNDVSPAMRRFLLNPKAGIDEVLKINGHLNLKTKLFINIPFLRRWITPDQVKIIILNKIKKMVGQGDIIFDPSLTQSDLYSQDMAYKLIESVKKYFQIFFIDCKSQSNEKNKMLYDYADNMLFNITEYTCNRIGENFNIGYEYNFSIAENKGIWLSYYLSEVFFFLYYELMTVKIVGKSIWIFATPKLEKKVKCYWLSEVCEESSNISDLHELYFFAKMLKNNGKLSPEERLCITQKILDKCFCIHGKYVSSELKKHPAYNYLIELVSFCIYIEMCALIGKYAVSKTELRTFVNPSVLDMINSSLESRKNILNSAKGFVSYSDGSYVRGPLRFKYGMRMLVKELMSKAPKSYRTSSISSTKKDFGGELGDYFEKVYILEYLGNIASDRYSVFGEFKPKPNAKVKDYDIDIILQDKMNGVYYFIQVKYWFHNMPIYLSERCRCFSDKKFTEGYTRQLKELKSHIDDESIRKKLSSHGVPGANSSNSYFILLHNFSFLNFYEEDGIFFYEWNLFRNILQKGRMHIKSNNVVSNDFVLENPELHRPEMIADSYLNFLDIHSISVSPFDVYNKSFAHFKFDGLSFFCKII